MSTDLKEEDGEDAQREEMGREQQTHCGRSEPGTSEEPPLSPESRGHSRETGQGEGHGFEREWGRSPGQYWPL